MVTLETIRDNENVKVCQEQADRNFAAIGYKEHGLRHAQLTANIAGNVLRFLAYPEREQELARIAAYLHDLGNALGQEDHAQVGALLVLEILLKAGMESKEIFTIVNAIGSHEEKEVIPPSVVTAAVILGDKTDVHRTRVRKSPEKKQYDTHDRVNLACERAFLRVNKEQQTIALELDIDTRICSVMDYFEIFLERTKVCRMAARYLGCEFSLFINRDRFL